MDQDSTETGARPSEALDVVLAHVTLQWEAEVENARRLSVRSTGLITLLVALLGLGLVELDTPERVDPLWLYWAGRMLLVTSLGAFLAALGVLLGFSQVVSKRDDAWLLASHLLEWSEGEAPDPFLVDCDEARRVAFAKVSSAAANLRLRNTRREEEIDRAQIWLFASAVLAAFSLVTYQLGNRVPSLPPTH